MSDDILLPADQIDASLLQAHSELLEREAALVEAGERAPETVEDDATAKDVTDFIKQISAATKAMRDAAREAKRPYDGAGSAVLGFFKRHIEPLDALKATMESRLKPYLVEKERKERERAKREADMAAARAQAARAGAETIDDLQVAESAERDARVAERAAAGPLGHARGDMATGGLRKRLVWEFTDVRDLDLEALRPHFDAASLQKAINAFMRVHSDRIKAADDGATVLRGVRFYEEAKAQVR